MSAVFLEENKEISDSKNWNPQKTQTQDHLGDSKWGWLKANVLHNIRWVWGAWGLSITFFMAQDPTQG
jgi:hypothetical protein